MQQTNRIQVRKDSKVEPSQDASPYQSLIATWPFGMCSCRFSGDEKDDKIVFKCHISKKKKKKSTNSNMELIDKYFVTVFALFYFVVEQEE